MDLSGLFSSLYASEIGLTVIVARLLFAAVMQGHRNRRYGSQFGSAKGRR